MSHKVAIGLYIWWPHTSSTLRRWSSARRAVVSSELMWPSGVFCTRSETVELFA